MRIIRRKESNLSISSYKLKYMSKVTETIKTIHVSASSKTKAWRVVEGFKDFGKRVRSGV